jgi:hypothetical protein
MQRTLERRMAPVTFVTFIRNFPLFLAIQPEGSTERAREAKGPFAIVNVVNFTRRETSDEAVCRLGRLRRRLAFRGTIQPLATAPPARFRIALRSRQFGAINVG